MAIRVDHDGLLIRLVHCKYSHGETAGTRVADLYEVCSQAQKSIMWRRSDLRPFFRTLDDRARKKQKREGVSPFEVGDIKKLYEIQDKALVLRGAWKWSSSNLACPPPKQQPSSSTCSPRRRLTSRPRSTHHSQCGAAPDALPAL
ncbi:hypothetical protein GCM10023322_52120 [Rugosimonospora acidiphila]|uniref:Uncharacterized protein n=1 Tax=Rugosimonospora acidiphila TaxID=556531 RepID=A0ABP9S9Y4_9ACTN